MRNLALLSIFIFFNWILLRANDNSISHEYIVTLNSSKDFSILKTISSDNNILVELLNQEHSIYLLIFSTQFSTTEEIQFLRSNSFIKSFSQNRKMNERICKPNDPSYSRQWNMSFMGFEDLWCFNRNGISPLGDTIVVGVIDQGFGYNIPDLNSNIFRNHKEIPDNKKDDDGNGFVDDYFGYNAINAGIGDEHPNVNHGTNIISLIGARGDNKDLMTGVNQQIKMLICSADKEDELIKCYSYFIKMKEDYLTSEGKKGAFIVVSSLSLGFDKAFPEDHTALCNIYDLLGSKGILNVCATVNEPENIDIFGDVPGLCASDDLIVVTNTDQSDSKVTDAGYSKNNVDLGAPGESIVVIGNDSAIQKQSGCSLSAPQVAGSIAYLNQYCEKFAKLSKSDPAKAIKVMKEFVYSGSKDNASLKGITSTGKRFDANGAFQKVLAYCDVLSVNNELDIQNTIVSQQELKFRLKFKKYGAYSIDIYNVMGQGFFHKSYNYSGQSDLQFDLPLEAFVPGAYFLVLKTEDELISQKFIKIN